MNPGLDVIELRGIRADCIVGVYPEERSEPQPLEIDLSLGLDTRGAASGGGLEATVDYARLTGEVRFLVGACRFRLLETAAEALARYVLAPPTGDVPRARVEEVTVRLAKPHALPGDAVASLRIHRTAAEYAYEVEKNAFGEVDVIHETPGCGIYRLRVAPGRSIPTHVHEEMDEWELVLGPRLLLQGRPVAPGDAFHWPKGLPHRYDNPLSIEQTILCVDRPAFIPSDERLVDVPLESLRSIEPVSFYRRAAAEHAREGSP
ncbi:dihydroneopterin aldolase [Vulgatibacter incomptus]|uniref:dihydroneopterin aldolase n=1 Tax=Vulgatibacter incomptus TaxID=1391653 RepID=A0A0K1PIK7_9BACT|nr:dihydroneopterin aldolase [Vulgatibacter incomptus]AKU92949.1 Dihydroneopterin aldolase [Vulgatibacter incomptus]